MMRRRKIGTRWSMAWWRAALWCAVLWSTVLWSTVLWNTVAMAQPERSLQRAAAYDENRWALVIGNAEYASGRLRNPENDALAMARVLGELGFQVDLRQNITRKAMENAIRTFGDHLNRGGVGIFYFAGHGVQLDGNNFLVPVDSNIRSDRDVKYQAVNLGFLLEKMGAARNGLNIVILDACRVNPFDGFRMLRQGLAQAPAPRGTILAYATAPGKVAADGSGRHGLFTEHLLRSLGAPGWTIETIFKRTREAVVEVTDGSQVPWTASSLVGEFVPRKAGQPGPVRPPGILPHPASEDEFSIRDLESQADDIEALRRSWADRLEEMKVAFEQSKNYEVREIPAQLKAQVWQRFLSVFEDDDPYTREDDDLRVQATRKAAQWRREVEERRVQPSELTVEPPPRTEWERPQWEPPVTEAPTPESGLPDPGLPESGLPESGLPESGLPESGLPVREPGVLWQEPVLGMHLRYIPAGRFEMGSPVSEPGHRSDEKPRMVTLTRGFWMGETEVTQGQWQAMLGNQPSRFKDCGESCPVEQMTWYGALAYANALSKHSGFEPCYELDDCNSEAPGEGFECDEVSSRGPSCTGYRLPTEAEWEYAARAGTTTPYWMGDNLFPTRANFNGNKMFSQPVPGYYRKTTVGVRGFDANPWGLYDIHGNVREWVWDGYAPYSETEVIDPTGPEEAEYRVFRGGGWYDRVRRCRSATRNHESATDRDDDVGFRLVRTAE